jgi:hypothetical protein
MKRPWLTLGVTVLVALMSYGWWRHSTRNAVAALPDLGCAHCTVALPCPDSAVRISVDTVGVITFNGQVIRAADLQQALVSLNPSPTEVCLFRANSPEGLPRETAVALGTIVSMRLRILSYTDATFRTAWKVQ